MRIKVEESSPVEAAIKMIGGKYKTIILWNLIDKTLRFSELQKKVPCATTKMLTQQLRELEKKMDLSIEKSIALSLLKLSILSLILVKSSIHYFKK